MTPEMFVIAYIVISLSIAMYSIYGNKNSPATLLVLEQPFWKQIFIVVIFAICWPLIIFRGMK